MRTKKIFRKNGNQDKENIDKNDLEKYQNTSMTMENNSNTINNPVSVGAHEEKQKTPNPENSDLLIQEDKSKQKQGDNNFILSDISNKSNEVETLIVEDINMANNNLTGLEACRGEKRPIEEPSNSIESDGNDTDFIQLKKKCLELEGRIKELEGMWMPCPQGLSNASNVFDDVLQSSDQDNVMNNNDEILNAIQILNIDSNILLKLRKKTATATARSILKLKFPSPAVNFKLKDMDKTVADAIVLYCKNGHPNDQSTAYKIRKAMSNYFSLITYKKKRRSMVQNANIVEQ